VFGIAGGDARRQGVARLDESRLDTLLAEADR
jgi:hypothetical protein